MKPERLYAVHAVSHAGQGRLGHHPMWSGIFMTNVGSFGLDAPYHHLFERGNCPVFLAMGKVLNLVQHYVENATELLEPPVLSAETLAELRLRAYPVPAPIPATGSDQAFRRGRRCRAGT
jgi:hypothetical protein